MVLTFGADGEIYAGCLDVNKYKFDLIKNVNRYLEFTSKTQSEQKGLTEKENYKFISENKNILNFPQILEYLRGIQLK